ncbi:MAG: PhoPQ-activated pathogenicity-related family protein [Verrucomicrobia bacterium]|nr:PhoPQ-activated pathogenicity-related family protein [Verrucomicrobiota bacterium]
MHPSRLRLLFLTAFALALTLRGPAADTARRGLVETALDRYVAAPDASFSWKKAVELRDESATGYALDLVSQNWLTPKEVNRTEWRHWLLVVKPDTLEHSTALLFIGGGANRPGNPPAPSRDLIAIAKATRSVVAEIRMVPNQTLVFHGDGVERKEDDLIAYTWDQFLRTGDERWPARLPMTKAAVRAMDAITAFLASDEGGKVKVDTFMVAGGSKRGWTTWTTAAVDKRVVAICPIVIDVLNVDVSITNHYRAYGFFAPAVGDYVRHQVVNWSGTEEARALYAIEDPYFYRDRLTMPKLIMNACGDQFFTPDSSRHYFSQLAGVKYLRYIPNTDHGLKGSDAYETLRAWHFALLNKKPLPQFDWKRSADGQLTVTTKTKPTSVQLWQATNPDARDFRLEKIGPVWKSSPIEGQNGIYTATVTKPAAGWTASVVELTFDVGAGVPLKFTTDVTVTPDTLPAEAPKFEKPKGFLTTGAATGR